MSCITTLSKSSYYWTLGSLKLWRSWSRSWSRSSSSALSLTSSLVSSSTSSSTLSSTSSLTLTWASWCELYSLYLFLLLTSLRVWPVRTVPAALIPYSRSVVRSFELVKRLSRWTACPFPWFGIQVISSSTTACVFEKPCFSHVVWSPCGPSSFPSPFICQRRSNTYPWSARTQILNPIGLGFVGM